MAFPETFPVIGGITNNFVEGLVEPYIEYYELHVAHATFSWVALVASLVVVLGGLGLGYLLYGRGFAKGQIDPLRKWLGPIWVLLHNKYYVDELYQHTIIPFTLGLSKLLYWIDDFWIIDPLVNMIGKVGVWIAGVSAAFDRLVVDGVVNGVASSPTVLVCRCVGFRTVTFRSICWYWQSQSPSGCCLRHCRWS